MNLSQNSASPELFRPALQETMDEATATWAPPPRLTVSEWADQFRRLSGEASSEPGKWSTARAEYQRGIMDAVSDPDVTSIVVKKGSQGGWTEIINNIVGFHIHQDPAPILVIQPTLAMGKAWSNDRLSPMIRDTPEIADIFKKIKSRDRNNTQLYKKFPGGHVSIAGANSPSSLASRPIRLVLGDEVSRYPASAGKEGDPLTLAHKRTSTFWNRKHLAGSTPTIAGSCRIDEAWEESDKRLYHVPCHDCGDMQTLVWSQVKWTGAKASTAFYACISCGAVWDDGDRHEAVSRGDWRATAPFNGIAGFHFWQAHSPWVALEEMVAEFLAAQGNPQRLKVFINTALGETWKEKGEAPEWKRLYDRAEDYKIGALPKGVLFLTAGVDVQHDRIEIYIWGWGRGLESWLIEYRVLAGDPYQADVWTSLDAVVAETWPHEKAADMPLVKVAIDAGYASTRVHAWTKKHPGKVVAVKGVELGAAGVGHPQAVDVAPDQGKKKKRRAGTVYPVVGGIYKSEFYGYLRLDAPSRESDEPYPQGYVHLAKFDEEVFQQLTAEQLVTRTVKFRKKTQWEKTRERNEALDCRVYARAAAAIYGIDRFRDKHWAQLEAHLGAKPKKPKKAKPAEVDRAAEIAPAPEKKTRKRWLGQRNRPWLRR